MTAFAVTGKRCLPRGSRAVRSRHSHESTRPSRPFLGRMSACKNWRATPAVASVTDAARLVTSLPRRTHSRVSGARSRSTAIATLPVRSSSWKVVDDPSRARVLSPSSPGTLSRSSIRARKRMDLWTCGEWPMVRHRIVRRCVRLAAETHYVPYIYVNCRKEKKKKKEIGDSRESKKIPRNTLENANFNIFSRLDDASYQICDM